MKSFLRKSKRVDQFLSQLYRTIETRESRDVVLLFVGEVMRMLAFDMELLVTFLQRTNRIRSIFGLPEQFLSHSGIKSFPTSANRATACARALSNVLDEWQIMNRLWGIMDMWKAAKELFVQASAKKSRGESMQVSEIIMQASQIMCLTSFHTCEAIAFLCSRQVVKWSAKAEEKLSFLSVRSWAAFTLIEIGRLLLDWARKMRNKKELISEEWKASWRKDLLQNLAWASVSLHWSRSKGLLPEVLVSPLAVFATWSLVKDVWKTSI